MKICKIVSITAKLVTARIKGTDYQFEQYYIMFNDLKLLSWRQFFQNNLMPQLTLYVLILVHMVD